MPAGGQTFLSAQGIQQRAKPVALGGRHVTAAVAIADVADVQLEQQQRDETEAEIKSSEQQVADGQRVFFDVAVDGEVH